MRSHSRLGMWQLVLSALIVAGCGGREASQYTGSVMDDSAADSASALTLTIWPSTDSTFTGHVRVGQPLGRGGAATAWHESSGLLVYSISEDGDTIAWRSSRSGEALGGTYEVVGGATKAQGGTWRARLASGPPATRATLRRAAGRSWVPPVDAVWPGLAFLAILAFGVRWVRQAPIPPAAHVRDPLGATDPSVGGWMAFFVFAQILGLGITLLQQRHALAFLDDGSWNLGAAVMGMRGVIVVEKLVVAFRLVASVVGLWLLATRSHYTPRFWFMVLVVLGVYILADRAAAGWLQHQATAITGPIVTDASDSHEWAAGFASLRSALVILLWALYWCHAARVRARFGYAALDRAPMLAGPADAALAG